MAFAELVPNSYRVPVTRHINPAVADQVRVAHYKGRVGNEAASVSIFIGDHVAAKMKLAAGAKVRVLYDADDRSYLILRSVDGSGYTLTQQKCSLSVKAKVRYPVTEMEPVREREYLLVDNAQLLIQL